MNSVGSNNLSLKYQRLTQPGCKDKGARKFRFVPKTQLLSRVIYYTFRTCLVLLNSLAITGVLLENILDFNLGLKELSLCHKLKYSNRYIFVIWQCTPLIFQT